MIGGGVTAQRGSGGFAAPSAWRPPNQRLGVRARARRMFVWSAVLGALMMVSLLGYVWVRIAVVEAGYRLSDTRQLVERLEREGRELEVRAAAADAPWRLQELASSRLGMRRPHRDEEGRLP